MNIVKQLRIEITGEEAEKIVRDHIQAKMLEQGYELDYSRNESETPWPDTMWRGIAPIKSESA